MTFNLYLVFIELLLLLQVSLQALRCGLGLSQILFQPLHKNTAVLPTVWQNISDHVHEGYNQTKVPLWYKNNAAKNRRAQTCIVLMI